MNADSTPIVGSLDDRWCRVPRIPLHGHESVHSPDRYVVTEIGGEPVRFDLYGAGGPFDEALVWSGLLVVGHGAWCYVVDPRSRTARRYPLDGCFGSMYPRDNFLLVASATALLRFDRDGQLAWTSDVIGLDGVLVDRVADGVIEGRGEWDPPGDWRPFRLSAADGLRLASR